MAQNYQLFIGGKWVNALSGKTFESLNPATGEANGYPHWCRIKASSI